MDTAHVTSCWSQTEDHLKLIDWCANIVLHPISERTDAFIESTLLHHCPTVLGEAEATASSLVVAGQSWAQPWHKLLRVSVLTLAVASSLKVSRLGFSGAAEVPALGAAKVPWWFELSGFVFVGLGFSGWRSRTFRC